MKPSRAAAVLLSLLPALLPSLVLAGGGEGAGDTRAALGNLLLRTVNFGILVGGLVWVARRYKLLKLLSGSVESVRRSLTEAEEAERAARARLAEAEERMARLQEEVAALVAMARSESGKERQALLAEAGREAEKIRRESQVALDQELKKVQESLRGEMAESVVRMAEEILRRGIRSEDQKRFVRDYLDKLEDMAR